MIDKNLHMVTLGCARNKVDSEVMAGGLKHAGWTLVDRLKQVECLIVVRSPDGRLSDHVSRAFTAENI